MIEKGFEIIGPAVAIVDVVGVLPHIAAQDRRAAMHQRIFAVRRLGDDELAVLHRDPAPAGAELGDAGLGEIFLHLVEAAEVAVDLGLELAGDFVAAAVRLHPFPEMQVVVMLAGIVEEAGILAEGALHDLFQRLAFQPVPFSSLLPLLT